MGVISVWSCAQLDGVVCRVLANLKGPVEAPNIVPLADLDERIMGRRYLAGAWAALTATAPKLTIAAGEVLPITVEWRDLVGILVNVPDEVTATSDAGAVVVPTVAGAGEFEFQAADVGTYTVKIRSDSGVETSLVVTVA